MLGTCWALGRKQRVKPEEDQHLRNGLKKTIRRTIQGLRRTSAKTHVTTSTFLQGAGVNRAEPRGQNS